MGAVIRLFPCRQDNFGFLIHDPQTRATASVDAPDAQAIKAALAREGWRLSDIIVTHHHGDHTEGIEALKAETGCRVIAPAREADKIPAVDETVKGGDTIKIGQLSARAIETPGHTLGQIAYYFADDKAVFVGDTLFSVGCGRIFEGDYPMMWNSLLALRALPDDTRIYCGHEYTQANIKFALTIEPGNEALKARAQEADAQRARGEATIPTTIAQEKRTNPFLRGDVAEVAAGLGMNGRPALDVFTEIRERKNRG